MAATKRFLLVTAIWAIAFPVLACLAYGFSFESLRGGLGFAAVTYLVPFGGACCAALFAMEG